MSPVVSDWFEEKVLVVAKAYPEPCKKEGECVCTAGITRVGKWLRLYPIPFRDLKPKQKYKKWQWISSTIAKHSDPRPESFEVQSETIKVGKWLHPSKNLDERKQAIEPGVFESLEELDSKGLTLGAFPPKEVIDLKITRAESDWDQAQLAKLSQQGLFSKPKTTLKHKRYDFRYIYRCNDSRCKIIHQMIMIDWDIQQTYFRFLDTYETEKKALEMLKEKWLQHLYHERKSYFIAGTQRRFGTWMLIGYFSLGLHEKLEQFQEPLF